MTFSLSSLSTLAVLLVVAWLASVGWAYFDARDRGKPGWLVAMLVLLSPWPAGLLAWLVFRPAPTAAASPKAFDLDDFKVQ